MGETESTPNPEEMFTPKKPSVLKETLAEPRIAAESNLFEPSRSLYEPRYGYEPKRYEPSRSLYEPRYGYEPKRYEPSRSLYEPRYGYEPKRYEAAWSTQENRGTLATLRKWFSSLSSDAPLNPDIDKSESSEALRERDQKFSDALYAGSVTIKEFGAPFVIEKYQEYLPGNPDGAQSLALSILKEINNDMTHDDQPENDLFNEWSERESQAFWRYTEKILDIFENYKFQPLTKEQISQEKTRPASTLADIFDQLRFRTDGGFASKNPNPLCNQVAQHLIDRDLAYGNYLQAVTHATEALIPNPKEYVDQQQSLYPEKMDNQNMEVLSKLRTAAKTFLALWE